MLIKDIVETSPEDVVSIRPTASLRDAAAALNKGYISALPVTDNNGKLLGLISERDIVQNIDPNGIFTADRTVDEVMSSSTIECAPDTTVHTALGLMKMLHIRHLPVVADKSLVGIVSIRDLAFSVLEETIGDEEPAPQVFKAAQG